MFGVGVGGSYSVGEPVEVLLAQEQGVVVHGHPRVTECSGNRRCTLGAEIPMRATRFPLRVVLLLEEMLYTQFGKKSLRDSRSSKRFYFALTLSTAILKRAASSG